MTESVKDKRPALNGQEVPEPDTEPEQVKVVEVTSLRSLVSLTTDWHSHKMRTLEHMLSVPEGASIELDEEAPLLLEGDLRQGFIMGLNIAMIELGDLPFYWQSTADKGAQATDGSDGSEQEPMTEEDGDGPAFRRH